MDEDESMLEVHGPDYRWTTTRSHQRYTFVVFRTCCPGSEDFLSLSGLLGLIQKKEKGVKEVKMCNQLHVTKNYVAQAGRKLGPQMEQVLPS